MKTSLKQLLRSNGERQSKLTLQTTTIDRSEDYESGDDFLQKYVLVEGDQQSLHFLGTVLIAFANGELGDTFNLHPQGAGLAHFSKASNIGIYYTSDHPIRICYDSLLI